MSEDNSMVLGRVKGLVGDYKLDEKIVSYSFYRRDYQRVSEMLSSVKKDSLISGELEVIAQFEIIGELIKNTPIYSLG